MNPWKLKFKMSFIITTAIEYLDVNLTKYVQHLYAETTHYYLKQTKEGGPGWLSL